MYDARRRRYNTEVVEGFLTPAQELVALAVALELTLGVELEGFLQSVVIDLHGVVDDQVDRDQRVHRLRIAPQLDDGVAHGGQVDDGGHTGEVLHDDTRRLEGDLLLAGRLRTPASDALHILARDLETVALPQGRLEQDLDGVRQPRDLGDAVLLEFLDTIEGALGAADRHRRARAERVLVVVCHEVETLRGWEIPLDSPPMRGVSRNP